MKQNTISHLCQFCKKETITLSPQNRTFKCKCGATYTYRAHHHTPGKGYARRQQEKNQE